MSQAPLLVVLAAGEGRRLCENKALYRLGALTAVEHVLAAGQGEQRLVVLGAEAERVRARLPLGTNTLWNPDWALGRTGGLRLALERCPGRDFLVAPVDVPLVAARTHRALREAWAAAGAPSRGWLAPAHTPRAAGLERRAGHPVLIGRDLLSELAGFGPDRPLKDLRAKASRCWLLPVDDEAILDDLDTPEDGERLRSRLEPSFPS